MTNEKVGENVEKRPKIDKTKKYYWITCSCGVKANEPIIQSFNRAKTISSQFDGEFFPSPISIFDIRVYLMSNS